MNRKEMVLLIVTLGLGLFLRLSALDAFLAPDEHAWALRSLAFRHALLAGDFAETYRREHPGVITMWLGTSAALGLSGGSHSGTELLFAARPLVPLTAWVSLLGMCWMISRIWGPKVALVSTVLIGLDPFYLAHSRLFHLDGLLTSFMTVSLLSLIVYLIRGGWGYLLFSGICAGVATLSKSSGVFMFLFALLLIPSYRMHNLRLDLKSLRSLIAPLALWTATAVGAFILFWPAMWVEPLETLHKLASGASYYAQTPHEGSNFFMGQPTPDPGGWFYPTVLLFRISPLSLVGAVLCLGLFPRAKADRALGALYLYVFLFGACMTIGAKKFDRYLLPVFPVIDLIGAIGWTIPIRWMAKRWRFPKLQVLRGAMTGEGTIANWLISLLSVGQLALILPCRPYYLSYYNPLVGGPLAASRTLMVGWGEGLDRAAQYLNRLPHAERLRVMSWYASSLSPFFTGSAIDFAYKPDVTTDYFVLYANQMQRHPDAMATYCGPEGPEHIVRMRGVDYAWICSSVYYLRPLIDHIRTNQQPGDILVVDDPSPSLAQALDMPYFYIPEDERGALSLVEPMRGAQRAWHVYLPDEPQGVAYRQLATWGQRLDEKTTELGGIALYGLPHQIRLQTEIVPTAVHWRSGVTLTGLEIANAAIHANQAVGLSLRWRLDHGLTSSLSVGLRLVDDQGHVWGTVDEWLLDERRVSTSSWQSGRGYTTDHLIRLLEGTPPGYYSIVATLVNSDDRQPLEIDRSDLSYEGASIRLGEVRVTRPAQPLLSGEMTMAKPASKRFKEGISLVGSGLLLESAKPGEALQLTLLWQAERKPEHRYAIRIQLRDREGRLLTEQSSPPIPSFPTSEWESGELFRGQYEVTVPADAPAGECELWVWLELEQEGLERAQPPANAWVETVKLGVRDRLFEAPAWIEHPAEYALGRQLSLLGYDVGETRLEAGESLKLTLYWRAEQRMQTSYKVFTHLLDGESQIWGQWDSVPVGGAYPTLGWLVGEVIQDRYEIPIRSDAPSGHYRLEVGMYDPRTGRRLPVVDGAGIAQEDNRVLLGVPIEIVREEPPK